MAKLQTRTNGDETTINLTDVVWISRIGTDDFFLTNQEYINFLNANGVGGGVTEYDAAANSPALVAGTQGTNPSLLLCTNRGSGIGIDSLDVLNEGDFAFWNPAGNIWEPIVVNGARVFLSDTAVSPAATGAPTTAEIAAAAPLRRGRLLYYTGDDTSTSTPTHVYWIDRDGAVTAIKEPVAGGTDELSKVSATDTTAGFLEDKVIAGANVTVTKTGSPGNETLVVAATVPAGASVHAETFVIADWVNTTGNEYTYTVTGATHGLATPYVVTVQEDDGTNYVPLTPGSVTINKTTDDVVVTIDGGSDPRFDGRIIIQ